MLEQLVKEIREGGTLEVNALARRLHTTPQVVAAMLDHLQRSGMISAYINCGEGCKGCGLVDTCQSQAGPTVKLWKSRT